MHNHEVAEEIEFFVCDLLIKEGINAIKTSQTDDDGYFDIMANGTPIEIKSSKLVIKSRNKKDLTKRTTSRFIFKKKSNLKKLQQSNGFVVFVVTWQAQHIILGAIDAEHLELKFAQGLVKLCSNENLVKFSSLVDWLKR